MKLQALGTDQRVRAYAQQLAGFGVEEHQRVLLDLDSDPAPAQDLRRQQIPAGQIDHAVLVHRPLHSHHRIVLRLRQRLSRTPPASRWMGFTSAQKVIT